MEFEDNIVISGISGRYPDSRNVEEFEKALFEGKNMITDNDETFNVVYPGMPKRSGQIPDNYKFDAAFFGLSSEESRSIDVRSKSLLETTFEAIIDAGYNPNELKGSLTGVYVGISTFTYSKELRKDSIPGVTCLDFCLARAANGISRYFDLKGPSYSIDTACSSSSHAFTNAVRDLADGSVDSALVCGSTMFSHPHETKEFVALNMLNPDCACKAFNKIRSGYVRAESSVTFFLQKESASRRVYAKVLGAKMNTDGFKIDGLTYPSADEQYILLKSLYDEVGVDFNKLDYIEAHGTGTLVGDLQECKAISKMLTTVNENPILIGSVKTNMGHSETASGLSSLTKVILAMERRIIPANLYTEPLDTTLPGFSENKLKVVTENLPWNGGIVGVNSFGFGGSNAHVILKSFEKNKVQPSKKHKNRLVCVSGRTEQAVEKLFKAVQEERNDEEFLALLDQIHRNNIERHPFRGYIILGDETVNEISKIESSKKQIWFIYSGLGSQWTKIGKDLMKLGHCRETFARCVDALKPFGIDLEAIVLAKANISENILHDILAITAIQISLTTFLFKLGIIPDGIAGVSFGEIGCGYADGTLTPEQAILLAYARGKASSDSKMSNVEGEVSHQALQSMKSFFKEILPNPKPKSEKWISTSVAAVKNDEAWTKYNSAEYHYNNYMSPILLDQVFEHIPENALVVEIAPHGVLQEILRRELGPERIVTSLIDESYTDIERNLLISIGRIFMAGGQPNLRALYPEVSFPVSRGTRMLSPLVEWDHSEFWKPTHFRTREHFGQVITVDLSSDEYSYLNGHNIDGKILMPAVGYLEIVWTVFANMHLKKKEDIPVVIENIKFKQITMLHEGGKTEFLIDIMKKSGWFEICEGDAVVVTGTIRDTKDISNEFSELQPLIPLKPDYPLLTRTDFYKECHFRRHMYKDAFQGVIECDLDGRLAKIRWNGNFTSFMDSMLHPILLSHNNRNISLPISIGQVVIDPRGFGGSTHDQFVVASSYDPYCNAVRAGGIEIVRPQNSPIHPRNEIRNLHLETGEFVHYESPSNNSFDMETSLTIALQIILQNTSGYIKNLKIWSTVSEELNTIVKTVLDNQALTQYEYVECVDGACRTEFDIFVIGPNISSHSNDHLKPGGFILQIGTGLKLSGMQVIFQAGCGSKNITLLTPKTIRCRDYEVLKIRKNEFSWLQRLEVLLQTNSVKVVYLVSQEGDINGVVDLMRVLSTESERLSFRSIVTDSNSKVFSVDDEMYQRQLEKNVAINILRNNGWGTYIHSPLENKTKGESMSIETAGELSPIPSVITRSQAQEEVKISYLGLDSTKTNMSDSMTCSGYSGVRSSGERVMGLVASEEVSTRFEFHSVFTWTIPKSWSLQEAATVPLAYATSYYALLVRGDMKKGESILIHSAAEEVGLAAIFISLSMEAVVFASVSSSKEKEFLKKLFPKLNDENIGIVTDGKVENIIMERTKGRGVDLVLNFTADSFQPSFMCLADRGRFLQIHKEDLVFDTVVNSYIFLRNCSFQEIDMDDLFHSEDEECEIVRDLIIEGIKTGVVKPLPSTVHEVSDMKSSTGVSPYRKHEGKALLRIDHDKLDAVEVIETGTQPLPLNLDSEKSYVIIGGLGDWGLELADWLIERGATKIVLNSEVTVFNAYQGLCLRRWSRNKDVVVKVTTFHISNPKMVEDLVLEARKLGPVGGVFSVSPIQKVTSTLNNAERSFQEVFKTEVECAQNLDTVTRNHCPDLDHFLLISLSTCGRESFGQKVYGMLGSILDRLCEKRKHDKFPGLSIQWGAVDVHVSTESESKIAPAKWIPQHVTACLNAIEKFIGKKSSVGSSLLVSELE